MSWAEKDVINSVQLIDSDKFSIAGAGAEARVDLSIHELLFHMRKSQQKLKSPFPRLANLAFVLNRLEERTVYLIACIGNASQYSVL